MRIQLLECHAKAISDEPRMASTEPIPAPVPTGGGDVTCLDENGNTCTFPFQYKGELYNDGTMETTR